MNPVAVPPPTVPPQPPSGRSTWHRPLASGGHPPAAAQGCSDVRRADMYPHDRLSWRLTVLGTDLRSRLSVTPVRSPPCADTTASSPPVQPTTQVPPRRWHTMPLKVLPPERQGPPLSLRSGLGSDEAAADSPRSTIQLHPLPPASPLLTSWHFSPGTALSVYFFACCLPLSLEDKQCGGKDWDSLPSISPPHQQGLAHGPYLMRMCYVNSTMPERRGRKASKIWVEEASSGQLSGPGRE